jgi:hypothetical protein
MGGWFGSLRAVTKDYDKPTWQFGRPVDTSEGTAKGVSPDVTRVLNALRDLYPQSLFDELRDHRGREIRGEFALYSAADKNAFASRYQDTYVFGLCGGLCDAFRHVARLLLSHPRLFLDVGDPTEEWNEPVGSVLPGRSGDRQSEIVLLTGPRCSSRKLYAEAMVSAMIYYVMHHEFLHFYYGHVDFFGRGQAYPIVLESAGRNDLATKSDVYRHISELEADGGAWRSLFERHALPLFGAAYSQLGLEEADWSRLFFNAMFLVTAVWVLLDRGPELEDEAWRDWLIYPAGVIRARALFRSPSVDATFVASLPEDVRRALAAGFSRCSVDLKEIGASFRQLEFLGRLGSGSWETPVGQYLDIVIRPHLDRFHEAVDPFRPRPPRPAAAGMNRTGIALDR